MRPRIVWTKHAEKRLKQRKLERVHVIRAAELGLKVGAFGEDARRVVVGGVKILARIEGDVLVLITVAVARKRGGIKRNRRKKGRR